MSCFCENMPKNPKNISRNHYKQIQSVAVQIELIAATAESSFLNSFWKTITFWKPKKLQANIPSNKVDNKLPKITIYAHFLQNHNMRKETRFESFISQIKDTKNKHYFAVFRNLQGIHK